MKEKKVDIPHNVGCNTSYKGFNSLSAVVVITIEIMMF